MLRFVALCSLLAAPLVGADYLSPELRSRVDRLKEERRSIPTDARNASERADVLWDWFNAYSLTGRAVPQDVPVLIRALRVGVAPRKAATHRDQLDFYLDELTLKDERPDAMPTFSLSVDGPLPVRSYQTIEQTLTVGSQSIETGGRLLLGRDGFNDHGRLQATDPAADGYVTIRSSNPDVRFRASPGFAGISLPSRVLLAFTLEGGPLQPGDQVTITYGDRSGGSPGLLLQSYAVDQFHLPVYVAFRADAMFGFTPDWPSIELVGRPEVARIHAVAPSVVEPGERFTLAVRSDDLYYNRASGGVPAYHVLLHDEVIREIPAGDSGLAELDDCVIDKEGVYRFRIRSADDRLDSLSNPVWVRRDPPYRIFWGDTHAHTKYAEGQGSPDGFYRFARDDARLDFVTLSEHDLWLDDYEWDVMWRLAESYYEPGRFLPILGYEWTSSPGYGGHHNVLYRDTERSRIGTQIAGRLTELYQSLRRLYGTEDALVIPHAHAPGDWTTSDGDLEKLIEIASVHGTFEYFGNRYLQQGWQVGFVGSTDNHHSHPGYTDTGTTFHTERNGMAAVLAPANTRDAVFDAMRDIRAYAVSGDRIILDVEMDGGPIGTCLPADARRRIRVRAMGTAPIDTIDVIKNGRVVYSKSYAAADLAAGAWVQVAFSSSSDVFSYRRPREYRTWEGEVQVSGADLRNVVKASFDNQHEEWVRRDEVDPARFRFRTLTRGRSDVLLLQLDDAGAATELRFDIQASQIDRADGPAERTPAAQFRLRLGEAVRGRLERLIESPSADDGENDVDAVRLQIVDPHAPLDRDLEFTDAESGEPGDYYYVRVTQIDGERAWSSPIWVGGEAR